MYCSKKKKKKKQQLTSILVKGVKLQGFLLCILFKKTLSLNTKIANCSQINVRVFIGLVFSHYTGTLLLVQWLLSHLVILLMGAKMENRGHYQPTTAKHNSCLIFHPSCQNQANDNIVSNPHVSLRPIWKCISCGRTSLSLMEKNQQVKK